MATHSPTSLTIADARRIASERAADAPGLIADAWASLAATPEAATEAHYRAALADAERRRSPELAEVIAALSGYSPTEPLTRAYRAERLARSLTLQTGDL